MIEIIPAIDIIEGKCVRLTQGDYLQVTTYSDDPVVAAKQFEDAGIRRLHLVDLDGARAGIVKNLAILEQVAQATELNIDFSGGIRNYDSCRDVINAGATFISIGSMAIQHPDAVKKWMEKLGHNRFILGADIKNGYIAVNGWLEQTRVSITDFIFDFMQEGICTFFCTDITRDGMLQGPSVTLYREIIERFENIELIASGGVASINDIETLENIGCSGVIIGKALYEGKIKITELC